MPADDALVERLRRRGAALQRQLDAGVSEIVDLKARLGERVPASSPPRDEAAAARELDILRFKAAEYDALMQTLTMRALQRPRQWYALARTGLATRAGH